MPSHEEFCATCSGRIFRAKPLSDMLGSRLHLHSNAHEDAHFIFVTLVMAPRAEHARPLGIALITRINPVLMTSPSILATLTHVCQPEHRARPIIACQSVAFQRHARDRIGISPRQRRKPNLGSLR